MLATGEGFGPNSAPRKEPLFHRRRLSHFPCLLSTSMDPIESESEELRRWRSNPNNMANRADVPVIASDAAIASILEDDESCSTASLDIPSSMMELSVDGAASSTSVTSELLVPVPSEIKDSLDAQFFESIRMRNCKPSAFQSYVQSLIPSKEENEKAGNVAEEIKGLLVQLSKEGEIHSVIVGGSFAKNTHCRGAFDLDVTVLLHGISSDAYELTVEQQFMRLMALVRRRVKEQGGELTIDNTQMIQELSEFDEKAPKRMVGFKYKGFEVDVVFGVAKLQPLFQHFQPIECRQLLSASFNQHGIDWMQKWAPNSCCNLVRVAKKFKDVYFPRRSNNARNFKSFHVEQIMVYTFHEYLGLTSKSPAVPPSKWPSLKPDQLMQIFRKFISNVILVMESKLEIFWSHIHDYFTPSQVECRQILSPRGQPIVLKSTDPTMNIITADEIDQKTCQTNRDVCLRFLHPEISPDTPLPVYSADATLEALLQFDRTMRNAMRSIWFGMALEAEPDDKGQLKDQAQKLIANAKQKLDSMGELIKKRLGSRLHDFPFAVELLNVSSSSLTSSSILDTPGFKMAESNSNSKSEFVCVFSPRTNYEPSISAPGTIRRQMGLREICYCLHSGHHRLAQGLLDTLVRSRMAIRLADIGYLEDAEKAMCRLISDGRWTAIFWRPDREAETSLRKRSEILQLFHEYSSSPTASAALVLDRLTELSGCDYRNKLLKFLLHYHDGQEFDSLVALANEIRQMQEDPLVVSVAVYIAHDACYTYSRRKNAEKSEYYDRYARELLEWLAKYEHKFAQGISNNPGLFGAWTDLQFARLPLEVALLFGSTTYLNTTRQELLQRLKSYQIKV
eukprot:TRINITY_DN5627_c0_g2_i6.p1 TRINITY_DN5627_c0_g2~~TRINITY_DN5627_c0_g2_i6.p1  ORF type:complete len:849 (-),score=97.85 TRINITY_DN5627_c0_g2_i6:339-2885(-)